MIVPTLTPTHLCSQNSNTQVCVCDSRFGKWELRGRTKLVHFPDTPPAPSPSQAWDTSRKPLKRSQTALSQFPEADSRSCPPDEQFSSKAQATAWDVWVSTFIDPHDCVCSSLGLTHQLTGTPAISVQQTPLNWLLRVLEGYGVITTQSCDEAQNQCHRQHPHEWPWHVCSTVAGFVET